MERKKENFIYKNFLESLENLRKIKSYLIFSFISFFSIFFIGLFFPIFFEEKILEIIKELINKTENLGFFELIAFIMNNNIKIAFFGAFLGIFLAVFPVILIIVNGYILGFVVNKIVSVEGIFILWRLLPHGVFEIPAILISVSLGLMIGVEIMKNCIKKYNKKNLILVLLIVISIILLPISFIIYTYLTISKKELRRKFLNNFVNSVKTFIFVITPLLVIAGIIEGVLIWLLS